MTDALDKINVIFGNAMYDKMIVSRYGLKSCAMPVDTDYSYDLLQIYGWYLKKDSCAVNTETSSESDCEFSQSCSLTSIEETIKTL